ncbi:uncharacterized protein LOC119127540 [Xyrichtys novacula]|uniref:Uncharacterized protein LOC119127540 n=1 Tax=Xyrichtys novacula TaxID=13765 RepID=A0AAV1F3H6_XYRNO|nr:uncharacterized protein LOC119127540 [Xyrichtys novacula]
MSMQPDNKRSRDQLSSSDHEDSSIAADLLRIRESMGIMEKQLQKLDLLKKLTDDVEELKHSVEYNNSLIDVLKQDNASLRMEVNTLKKLTADLQQKNHKMSNDILDMQSRSMRDNIIIHGLPETQKETYQSTEQLVKTFMKSTLKMEEREVDAIRFSRVHRVGQAESSRQKSRPIVAKVVDTKMKISIMGRGKELRGTNYSISDQYPPEILRRRRLLHPVMTEVRKNNKKARLVTDKLYIDGKLYSNPEITHWLFGGDTNTSR